TAARPDASAMARIRKERIRFIIRKIFWFFGVKCTSLNDTQHTKYNTTWIQATNVTNQIKDA
ncbi:MAG: hypothetical protein KBB66_08965, partial [Prolixibacteraceae bacterium]|nr:hypothetical protein [Prolixibacteraceae bacterium]